MSRITRSCRWCMFNAGSGSTPRPRRHPLAAVSASSVGSLANHSLCNCEAVLRQYGGGRLLAQSITMRRVYQPDNQQTQLLLPRLRRPSKWELRSARSEWYCVPEVLPFLVPPYPPAIRRRRFQPSLYLASATIQPEVNYDCELTVSKWYTWSKSCSNL